MSHVPRWQISTIRSDRSLPMPGHSRSASASRPATGSGVWATTSAALRYARILKGFSPFNSSMSAISPRTRAIAWLSSGAIHAESFGFDAEVEQPRPRAGKRLADCGRAFRRRQAEQAAASARAAHLASIRSCCLGAGEQIVDRGRADAGREPLAVLPLARQGPAHLGPVAAHQGLAHGGRGVADAFEALEHMAIAVDVPLHDLPVVGAGVP